ncbi:RAQPRD family integrative conjugative element protein [Serratia fonticola]|uniref:RAQPRD family integrative conjugative element protein n=1 Tax=Serratia fonticola TaxID=47917 RepID=A0AAJ1YC48_SERFO|nr:RAQPRD family integrative conjugative element protein [Serratia fonticola]MDQ9127680.1 RAQPRD family integrative conjugative element protein [Serratia fonticola]
MHIARALCLAGSLFTALSVQAGEKDELALVMKQLDQVQASLEHARVVAVQDGQSGRFHFDYLRATQDVNTMRRGIEFYLEPSRAQPTTSSVSGQYRQERR